MCPRFGGVEQPPTSSPPPDREPDLPKPPIWDRQAPATPPIQIPRVSEPNVVTTPQDTPRQTTATRPPIVPDVRHTGPQFVSAAPASGAGVADQALLERAQWPAAPPIGGHATNNPTPPSAPRPRRRVGMFAIALLLAAAVAAGAFLFGRSVGDSETVTTPVSAPTTPAATEVPIVPTPTQVPPAIPTAPPANDAQAPLQLPNDAAVEPVTAVAQAVAPAVVLIQHDFGQGSGIVYDDSGLILTNAHVVGSFTEVLVTLASGVRVPGQVLGADPLTDVAVVSISTDADFGVAALAPETSVEVGQLAVAIGSPFGLEQTVTSGIVSAKGRVIENLTDDGDVSVVAMIQTDAPINPGNSGGALADRQGRVIGMNTSIRTDGSGGNIGVGFAIPSDTAKLIADRIIAGEPLERGFLGINGGSPLVGEPGVVVGEVTLGSGADAAGLLAGDRITAFNGIQIKDMSDLAAAVRLQPPDATVVVEFIREDQTLSAEVVLGAFS